MFGLVTFAELIFADIGNGVYVNSGWDKYPAPDCDEPRWSKLDSACDSVSKIEKGDAEWTVIK